MNKEERAKSAANEILNFVNAYGYDSKTFAKTIASGHKTLQQSTMRLFVETMRALAEVSYDDRNAETVQLAKELTTIADNHPLPFI